VRIDVFTIFPGIFESPLRESLLGKAVAGRLLEVRVHDLRDWTSDPHRKVDDSSFGGGPGMVMQAQPIFDAVESLDPDRGRVLLLSPAGRRLDQAFVRELAVEPHLTLICGRYEGIDERVVEGLPAEEVSIGDYVLSGGEVPAIVTIEAVARLVPGVIGREESHDLRPLIEQHANCQDDVHPGDDHTDALVGDDELHDEEAEEGYKDVINGLDRKPHASLAGLANVQRLMKLRNPNVGKVKAEDLIDDRFMKKLDQSGFIDEIYARYGVR